MCKGQHEEYIEQVMELGIVHELVKYEMCQVIFQGVR